MQLTRPVEAQRLPAGFRAVALSRRGDFAAAVALIARTEPDPAAGHLIVLRNDTTATVYLGCLLDESGMPKELLQIWVQATSVGEAVSAGQSKVIPNAAVDARWKALWNGSYQSNPSEFILCGYETKWPHPMLLDPKSDVVLDLTAEGGWELCVDDAVLAAAQLPAYSSTDCRFLYQRKSGAASKFVRVAGQLEGGAGAALEEIVPSAEVIAFNVACGFLAVSRYYPLDADEYADLLAGRIPAASPISGTALPAALQPLAGIDPKRLGAGVFFNQSIRQGARMAEIFHLKVLLLGEMFELTRRCVAAQGLPLLNLSIDSFRVRFSRAGFGLPFLWSAEVTLNRPSEAYLLKAGEETQYYISLGQSETTIFRPQGVAMHLRGAARNLSIRRVTAAEGGRYVIEGTIRTEEALVFAQQDLLWMEIPFQLPSGSRKLPVYARLYEDGSRSAGEYSFRSLPTQIPEALVPVVTKTDRFGATFHRVGFELIPMVSTPVDLYSLAIISLRALLGNSRNNLGDVVDRVQSLISHLENTPNAAEELSARVAAAFQVKNDGTLENPGNRFVEILGPQNLVDGEMSAAEAFQLLPPSVWFGAIAMVLRCFPGHGVENICKDYSDAPAHGLETIFERPLQDLETLALQSRSLMTVDWTMSREIQTALSEFVE